MIRPDIRHDLKEYLAGRHPYPFGSFVTAVLANDLIGALGQADEENRENIFAYASFLYNEMPGRNGDPAVDWWGSYEAVNNRIAEQRAEYAAMARARIDSETPLFGEATE